jgi:hypothetical protein
MPIFRVVLKMVFKMGSHFSLLVSSQNLGRYHMGPNLILKKVTHGNYQGTLFSNQQAAHHAMALPNVI